MKIRPSFGFRRALAALFASVLSLSAQAQTLFVSNVNTNSVSTYNTSGTLTGSNIITGLSYPTDLVVSGNYIYVLNRSAGSIEKYTTDGTLVTSGWTTITGLSSPTSIAVSGGDIYVANNGAGTVAHYSTSGSTLNASLISSLTSVAGIAVNGSNLYVTSGGGTNATIYQYGTDGSGGTALVTASSIGANELRQFTVADSKLYYLAQNATTTAGFIDVYSYDLSGLGGSTQLISGADVINAATDITVANGYLYVSSLGGTYSSDSPNSSHIGVYGLDGSIINASLISAQDGSFYSVAASAVPEPATYALIAGAAMLGFVVWRRRCRSAALAD